MRIQPIQYGTYYPQKTENKKCNSVPFKSEAVKAIIKSHEVPTNQKLCRELWVNVMTAFSKEPSLTILRPDLYNDSLKHRKMYFKYIGAFFRSHNIRNMEDGYSIEIARDNSGSSLIYMKDKEGVSFLYTTDEPDKYIRFGSTPVRSDDWRHPFYQTSDIYVEYHIADNADGCAKEVRTLSGLGGYNTKYYDETGHTNLATNARGMLNDFLNIFK